MKYNHLPIRYPASPQSNAFSKEASVAEAERNSYLFRLRNKSFRDNEIAKCQTLAELEQVTNDIIESQRLQKISENVSAFHEMQNPTHNDDIPIVDDVVGLVSEEDLRQAGHIDIDGNFSETLRRELTTCIMYNDEGMQISPQSIESKLKQINSEIQQEYDDDSFEGSSTKLIFEKIIPSGIWDDIRYEDYSLPGVAEPYTVCQKHGLLACVNSAHHHHGKDIVKSFRYSCKRGTCKKCAEAWANREAIRIRDRIFAYRENIQKMSCYTRNPKPSHCVISFPEKSDFGMFTESKKKRIIRNVLKNIGSLGGCEIFHPFRFAKKSGFIPRVSPHYHYIVYGWFDEFKIKKAYQKYGVIFKKIDTLHTPFDVFGVAKYILSHSGQKKKRHAVKWIGELGYRKLKVEKTLDVDSICVECGQNFVPVKIVDYDLFTYIPPPDIKESVLLGHGAVVPVDFVSGEQIPYYDEDWTPYYKKQTKEMEAEIRIAQSIAWHKTSIHSEKITQWTSTLLDV